MYYVMGIDPSFTCTGWSIFVVEKGRWKVVDTGAVKTEAQNKKLGIYKTDDDQRRIMLIMDELTRVARKYELAAIVSEQPAGGGKSSSAVKGMAFATCMVTCLANFFEIGLVCVPAGKSKKFNCGTRNASKQQMQDHVASVYPEIADQYRAKTKTGFKGEFEDIADSICAVLAAHDESLIRALTRFL